MHGGPVGGGGAGGARMRGDWGAASHCFVRETERLVQVHVLVGARGHVLEVGVTVDPRALEVIRVADLATRRLYCTRSVYVTKVKEQHRHTSLVGGRARLMWG